MDQLFIEIKAIILNFLDLESQIKFIFVSKNYNKLIKYWRITKEIKFDDKLLKLSYYDCFENITTYKNLEIYPKNLKMFNFRGNTEQSIKICIRCEAPCVCQNPIFCKNRILTNTKFSNAFNV